MECNNCLCNLDKCNAECCKLFLVKAMPHQVYRKGQILTFECKDLDLQHYYILHGCKVGNNTVYIKLEEFKVINHMLHISLTCEYLQDNKCIHHSDGLQPKICAFPNINNPIGDGVHKLFMTPNCIYKRD